LVIQVKKNAAMGQIAAGQLCSAAKVNRDRWSKAAAEIGKPTPQIRPGARSSPAPHTRPPGWWPGDSSLAIGNGFRG
jgi:hypothetical protein